MVVPPFIQSMFPKEPFEKYIHSVCVRNLKERAMEIPDILEIELAYDQKREIVLILINHEKEVSHKDYFLDASLHDLKDYFEMYLKTTTN